MTTDRLAAYSLLFFTLLLGPATADGADAAAEEFDESVMGEWLVESANLAGKVAKPNPSDVRIRVTKNKVLFQLTNKPPPARPPEQ